MLVQLQQMIDTVATQAAPVMREVAAKAAELAAVAGEKAGPLAYKAAEVTEIVGQRVAARSKEFAADMRRPTRRRHAATTTDPGPTTERAVGGDEPTSERGRANDRTVQRDDK